MGIGRQCNSFIWYYRNASFSYIIAKLVLYDVWYCSASWSLSNWLFIFIAFKPRKRKMGSFCLGCKRNNDESW
jgi:hypothetical protein